METTHEERSSEQQTEHQQDGLEDTLRTDKLDWGAIRQQAIRLVHKFGMRHEDAEDAVQEAIRLFLERNTDEKGIHVRSVAAWLAGAARNIIRSNYRRRSRERPLVLDTPDFEPQTEDELTPSSQIWDARSRSAWWVMHKAEERDAVQTALEECIAALTDREQQLIRHHYEDKTITEVALDLGITPDSARVTLFRARRKLFLELAKKLDPDFIP